MTNVLIVGAGPTGLTAALELARNGIKARIIDRDDGPTQLSKAVGISPHSLDILEPSGVMSRLLDAGLKIRRAHLWSEQKALVDLDITLLKHRFQFVLSLPQSHTEQIMSDRLNEFGLDVERRCTMVSLEAAGDKVNVATEKDGVRKEDVYDIVLGADGPRSAVREASGIAFEGSVHDRLWSIADAIIPDWPHDREAAHAFLQGKGDFGFVIPIARDRYRCVANTADALSKIPQSETAGTTVLIADTFRLPVEQAATYQKQNVYLAGDAAHVHSPIGARGMNLGIEDAACFAQRLLAGTLKGYTDERHPIGKRWIAFSERALSAIEAENFLASTARDLVLRLVGTIPAMQRLGIDRVAGLQE